MSERPDTARTERIRALHEARARAELADADALAPGSDSIPTSGTLLAEVALVKGLPGVAETSGGPALSGADGTALEKALVALGWPGAAWFGLVSRPEPSTDPGARVARLRGQLEAVDPRVIIALDAEAAADVAAAFDIPHLSSGVAIRVLGRRVVALDGFEASLGDEKRKRRVWQQLRAAGPEHPIY